jgi:hypothetical protein
MLDLIKENSVLVSIISLCVAALSLTLNKKTSRMTSYNSRGNYIVYFSKIAGLKKFFTASGFSVKIYNSALSDIIELDHKIHITPLLGGIRRAQIFDGLDNRNNLGISKTIYPAFKRARKIKFPRRYAHDDLYSFNSSPFFAYFSASGKHAVSANPVDRKLNRYHSYIEITDYSGHSEIWYFSFSLHLSNLDTDFVKSANWKRFRADELSPFKYYRFADFTVLAPVDLYKNLATALTPQIPLSEIRGCNEEHENSDRLMQSGYESLEYELQQYELREYYSFLSKIKQHLSF